MVKDSVSMPLGVVVERREIDHPWCDHSWRPVAVIPGAPEIDDWRLIAEGEGWAHFHAATLPLELYPREAEGYRLNLSKPVPAVYVVLRPGEEAEDHEVEPFLVTVCPYEAQDYLDADDDIVEGVAMPEAVIAWVQDFVDRHYRDEPFVKRKRKKWKEAGGHVPAGAAVRRGGGRR